MLAPRLPLASCWVSWGLSPLGHLCGRFQNTRQPLPSRLGSSEIQLSLTTVTYPPHMYSRHHQPWVARAGQQVSVSIHQRPGKLSLISCALWLGCPGTKEGPSPYRGMSFTGQARQIKMPNAYTEYSWVEGSAAPSLQRKGNPEHVHPGPGVMRAARPNPRIPKASVIHQGLTSK